MDVLKVCELVPVPVLGRNLCEPFSGTLLLHEGDPLTAQAIQAIHATKLETLLATNGTEDISAHLRQNGFQKVPLSSIESGHALSYNLYDGNGKLLLTKGTNFTPLTVERLRQRGINDVQVRQMPAPDFPQRLKALRLVLERERRQRRVPPVEFSASELLSDPTEISAEMVEHLAQEMESTGQFTVAPAGISALIRMIQTVDALQKRPDRTKSEYVSLYESLVRQTDTLFDLLLRKEDVDGELILNITESIIAALIADRHLLLNTIYLGVRAKKYLPSHSVNVALLAINIACESGFTKKQVTELAYGALLADVGMLEVDDKIVSKPDELTQQERMEVMRHTIYGIERLQKFRKLPKVAPIVAYQSHERLDGSGYPHGKTKHTIHDYAKIVMIADTYLAMISSRPHRKGVHPYKAIERLLKMTSARKLDNHYTRKMLEVLSLFPIGSWVQLNTGEIAKVLAPNQREFTRPVVAILFDEEGRSCNPRRIDLAKLRDREVVKPVVITSADVMQGF